MHGYYVYILTSVNRKVMYVGVTNNLENRVAQHRDGTGSAFTHRYRVNVLVYAEDYQFIDDVIAREKQIKGWSRAKKRRTGDVDESLLGRLAKRLVVIDPSLRSG